MSYALLEPCPKPARQGRFVPIPAPFVLDTGHWVEAVPQGLRLRWQPDAHAEGANLGADALWPAYMLGDVPLFSVGLLTALARAGVHNVQAFDVPLEGTPQAAFAAGAPPYRAANVLGLVNARMYPGPKEACVAVVDAALYLHPEHVRDLALFRLAFVPGAIVVHRDIIQSLIAQGFDEPTAFTKAPKAKPA